MQKEGMLKYALRSKFATAKNKRQGIAYFCANIASASMLLSVMSFFHITRYPIPIIKKTGKTVINILSIIKP
tara:strand:- start:217 stop:432 length:216 start_codon:yes stop_codon:yes gene_type:complete